MSATGVFPELGDRALSVAFGVAEIAVLTVSGVAMGFVLVASQIFRVAAESNERHRERRVSARAALPAGSALSAQLT